ncbi:hypothetical protein MYK68_06225 [Gordonia sp. PP30]|uniref:hypothetical protein n=1 Tax=Gordonia sp. PP30 TaxID=2935861 RepID=UPI001FFF8980|nr:hypothetical protein [Gordonia sp. PP30]UQE76182.1 hypothetical protein MYK68_06225 [Gordonia sp. PP30]
MDRFFGDRALDRSTERIGGSTGAVFDEQSSGTNAIATCLETRAPVNVFGAEHYLDRLRSFDCYGIPILNPVTRRLEGVVDLMMDAGLATDHRRALEALLDRMVHEISLRLLSDYDPDVQQAVAAFTTLARRSDDAVILLGRDFVLHNRRALDELTTADIAGLEAHASTPGEALEATVTLESGREVTVQTYQHLAGQPVMLRVRNGVRARPPVPRVEAGSATARTATRIDRLTGSTAPVLVIGEPGTGRSTAARRIAGEDARTVAAAMLDDDAAAALYTADPATAAPLIVEEIDRLSAHAVTDLALLVRQGRRVVFTVRAEARDDIGYLGGLCAEWLELPPLRRRRLQHHRRRPAALEDAVGRRPVRCDPPGGVHGRGPRDRF